MSNHEVNETRMGQTDEILELARSAGLLVTLDGQIGREKYQSIFGSLTSFMRFVEALRANIVANEIA